MMKKALTLPLAALFCLFLSTACKDTDVVESGTYTGTIIEVEPEKDEIYVRTPDGNTLELYFTETTTLTKNDEPVDFSMLKENLQVEVEVKKVGKRLDPIGVRILE